MELLRVVMASVQMVFDLAISFLPFEAFRRIARRRKRKEIEIRARHSTRMSSRTVFSSLSNAIDIILVARVTKVPDSNRS